MNNLKKNFTNKYNSVSTKTTYKEDEAYKECVFKSEFFKIPIREKFVVDDNYLITSSEWGVIQPMSIPVDISTGIFKFQFELEGYSSYLSAERDILIEADHFNFFFLPEVRGTLNYRSKRKVTEIMFDRQVFLQKFAAELPLFKDFGVAVENNQAAVLFEQAQRISPELKKILFSLMNCNLHPDLRPAYIEHKVKELMLLALNQADFYVGDKLFDTNLSDDEKLIQIKVWIDEDVLKHAKIAEISKRFGINEFKLKNGFKKHYGLSVMRYIKNTQLQMAYELLSEGQRSVQEVSILLGYQYPQHFAIAFKKMFNKTPSSLRIAELVTINEPEY